MSLIREIAEMTRDGFEVTFYEYRPSVCITDNVITLRVLHLRTREEYGVRIDNEHIDNEYDRHVVLTLREIVKEHNRRHPPTFTRNHDRRATLRADRTGTPQDELPGPQPRTEEGD